MKNIITDFILKIFKNFYNNDDLLKIKYSIEGIYINISKFVVLFFISYVLNISCLFAIFILLFTPLRIFGYGYHANTSLLCYFLSIFSFIFLPYFFSLFKIHISIFLILAFLSVYIYFIYAPRSTPKGLATKKSFYYINKTILIILAVIYILFGIYFDKFRNLILLALLLEGFYITPILYRFFPKKCRKEYL